MASAALVLALAGCRPIGPGTPTCGQLEDVDTGPGIDLTIARPSGESAPLNASELIQLQAVPSASWGVCVEELPVGWSTGIVVAEQGQAELTVASTDLGLPFLTATLTERCEVPERIEATVTDDDGPPRFMQIHDITAGIEVAVIPVAARHHDAAVTLTATLAERELRGIPIRVTLDASADDVTARIDRALQTGATAMVIDDGFLSHGQVELRDREQTRVLTAPLGRALAELGERADPEVYAATWWHPSAGSCVTYRIAARGPGALELPERIDGALGWLPLSELRDHLENAGYEIGSTP